ncbi:MAG: lamin tail domain-containing protein [Anaerolineales bacterium]|nr:lamin tail domain-containing protein [Anaerolineales bacterium]
MNTCMATGQENAAGVGRIWWLILTLFFPVFLLVSFLRLFPAAAYGPESFHDESATTCYIVINEVAWGGTAAESGQYDEWIELYNPTTQTVFLDGWHLTAVDGIPAITLKGLIKAKSFYLLERQDDGTVSDRPADLIYTGALENNGETMELRNSEGVLVDSSNLDGGGWPGGSGSPDYFSMERIDPYKPDQSDNWTSNNGIVRNGLDADGQFINGTPGAWNSAGVLADLVVIKIGPAGALPGATLNYTISVANSGAVTATGVLVTDTLPAGVDLIDAAPPYSYSQPVSDTLVWRVGDIPPGGSPNVFTVSAQIGSSAIGALTNTVAASTTAPERELEQNFAIWITQLCDPAIFADLTVAKSAPSQVLVGQWITYEISLKNNGAVTAANVVLTDSLPAGVDLVGQSSGYPFIQTVDEVIWQIGELPPAQEPITVTLTVLVGEYTTDQINNIVTATCSTPEMNSTDNSSSVSTQVLRLPMVRLTAVHYYALQTGDEAVLVTNLGTGTADISGWKLTDNEQEARFPSGTVLPAGISIWAARDAADFRAQFGHLPDLAIETAGLNVPKMLGSWPLLANYGDEVVLLDDGGQIQDAIVYLKGDSGQEGWNSQPVEPYHPGVFSQEGQILYRKLDQSTGRPVTDTDTASDWAQEIEDPVDGRKVRYPGWDLESFFLPLQITTTGRLTVAVGPDHLFEVMSATLNSAQSQLLIQSYTFENTNLAYITAARAAAGVSVTVLLEGVPAGEGITDQERWVCHEIESNGGRCLFMISDDASNIHDRYRYQHAKFIVVDGKIAMIGSENLSLDAMPDDAKGDGTAGRRGIFLITDAPEIVSHLETLFWLDADLQNHQDIAGFEVVGSPPDDYQPIMITNRISYTVYTTLPMVVEGEMALEMIQSPENALRDRSGLLGILARVGAGDRVMVEQMHEPLHWGSATGNPVDDPNLRLAAYLAAARRGADVRVLLDGYFQSNSADNRETCAYLSAIASIERLQLDCALANPTGLGIHNKMVLAEIGGQGYIHVGSINGSELSNKGNREVALQVQSDPAFAYLAGVFERDWPDLVYLPLVSMNYIGPASYPLISEVLYDPAGGQDNAQEWVELYNPTGRLFNLENWMLGDAVNSDDYEATYKFPQGAAIQPGQVLVVAVNAQRYFEENGVYPDYELWGRVPAVPDLIRYKKWGDGDFALGNAGDEVILYNADEQSVDVLSWGTGSYPGVTPHPGVLAGNHSLERSPSWRDTDDCSFDFWERPSPGPGQVEG